MGKYKNHKYKWKNCKECNLCESRSRVVMARGRVPCDVLFIGEAPGVSEDVLGRPFVGPAGKLLDKIVGKALEGDYSWAMTNLVCCIPKGKRNGDPVREPSSEEVGACSDRLREFVGIAKPRLIVSVGKLAEKHVSKAFSLEDCEGFLSIVHPAFILRADISQRGLLIQKTIIELHDAAYETVIPF